MTTTEARIEPPAQTVDLIETVERLRNGFQSGITRTMAWRHQQLDALEAMVREGQDSLAVALEADLGKSAMEAWTTEIGYVLSDIDHIRSNLDGWAKSRKVPTPLVLRPGRSSVIPEPKGVVLVLAPWNYPAQLTLSPMAAAIAAGNAVLAKPSELAPATAAVLIDLAARFLDCDTIAVVGGGVEESTTLLEQRFDHVFFTGSTRVGQIVMEAAAKHLTPVTLELGGKSPAIVAPDANLDVAANRIAWGKLVNAGQTCVAPDYVLVGREQHDELVELIGNAMQRFYGDDASASRDFGRIVNEHHARRLESLLNADGAGTVAYGGVGADVDRRFIPPTVLVGTDPSSLIMQEEIFGPLLPVIAVDSLDDAVAFVNERPKPLALYVFSASGDMVDEVTNRTSSGGVCVNGTVVHLAVPDLPFGGVGPSGMGAYHGQAGFDTFSHLKAVFHQPVRPEHGLLYPPYTERKTKLIKNAQSASLSTVTDPVKGLLGKAGSWLGSRRSRS